eukprot:544462_1
MGSTESKSNARSCYRTPGTTQSHTNVETSTEEDDLLVTGYVRRFCLESNIDIPIDIIALCYDWYHAHYQLLAFKPRAIKSFKLTDNNQCAHRLGIKQNHSYVAADCDPVFDGVHCWRIHTVNPFKGWIGWFVHSADTPLIETSFTCPNVWGISNASQYYINGGLFTAAAETHSNIHAKDPHTPQFCCDVDVDMQLDCDKGTLKFCVVGASVEDNEKVFVNLPTNTGWIPHFNVYVYPHRKNCKVSLRIASIPCDMYSIRDDDIFSKKQEDHTIQDDSKDFCICGGLGMKYLTDGIMVPCYHCYECAEGDKYDSEYCESD